MSPTHWLIVIGVLVLLFGAKKLPDMARSIGQSTRVFKGEMKGLREDDTTDGTDAGSASHESTPQPGAVPQAGVTPSAATDPSTDPAPGTVSTTSTGSSPD